MISCLRNSDTLFAPCPRLILSRVWYSSCVTRTLTMRVRLTKLNGISRVSNSGAYNLICLGQKRLGEACEPTFELAFMRLPACGLGSASRRGEGRQLYRWATGADSPRMLHARKGRAVSGRDRPYPIPVHLYGDRAPEYLNRDNQAAGTFFVDKYAFDALEWAALHSHQIAALKVGPRCDLQA